MKKIKTNPLSLAIFVITLGVVIINVISLLWPALIVNLTIDSESLVDPFEPGEWAIPFLISNVAIFYFWYLYSKNSLPRVITNSIKFIVKFEVSRKVAAIVIAILLGGYIIFTIEELGHDELDQFKDWAAVELALKEDPFGGDRRATLDVLYVKNFLLRASQVIFQNYKVIPFIASISLLVLTYFFTLEITKKRFAGIVSMIILLQSFTFLEYDTSATYPSFWILFFVLSLYIIYKKGYFSSIPYFLSIACKPITALFFPILLFLLYNSKLPRKKKIYITITYAIGIIIIGGVFEYVYPTLDIFDPFEKYVTFDFDNANFWAGFATWPFQLRFNGLFLLFICPVIVGLFVKSRMGVTQADSILVLILGTILYLPFFLTFTNLYGQPYRELPLIIFFAVGVGTLLSKKISQEQKKV